MNAGAWRVLVVPGRDEMDVSLAGLGYVGVEAPDPARREEGEYPVYSTDEQRRGAGCLGSQNASVISLQALSRLPIARWL